MPGRPRHAVFIHSKQLEAYAYPAGHPFITRRAAMAREKLASIGLLAGPNRSEIEPEPATQEALERFHTRRYLDALRCAGEGELDVTALSMGLGSSDCPVFRGVYEYAVLACGGTLAGVAALLSGEAGIAFNPSGGYHHAGPERASGFCYVNDVAIGCLVLAEAGRRVFYLDIDVHHGDGVQNAFYDRSDVMTVSLHETGTLLFPGTGSEDEIGTGEGRGYAVNVPLPPGTYDAAYLRAFEAIVPPLLRAFAPDVVVLELGMDALAGDPLAHLNLTNNAHAAIIERLLAFDVPMLVTGGGGYQPDATARGWALAWTLFCGDRPDELHAGMGGVLLETSDWEGGLRDRELVPDRVDRRLVDSKIDRTLEAVKAMVFPLHGL